MVELCYNAAVFRIQNIATLLFLHLNRMYGIFSFSGESFYDSTTYKYIYRHTPNVQFGTIFVLFFILVEFSFFMSHCTCFLSANITERGTTTMSMGFLCSILGIKSVYNIIICIVLCTIRVHKYKI